MKIVDSHGQTMRSDSDVLQSVPIESLASPRLKPRQVSTGITRGYQGVGGTDLIIDAPNQRITVGGITIDGVNNTITFEDGDDNQTITISGVTGTFKLFDPNDDDNERLRIGKQPDDTYNVVTAKDGYSIDDVFA